MRARRQFFSRLFDCLSNEAHVRLAYRRKPRRFEGLESRLVLCGNGIVDGLAGDPDYPVEITALLADQALVIECDSAVAANGAVDPSGVWDDTDIVHVAKEHGGAMTSQGETGIWDDTDIVHPLDSETLALVIEHLDIDTITINGSGGSDTVWDDTDITHLATGTHHDAALADLASPDSFFPELTQKEGFLDVLTELPGGVPGNTIIDVGDLPDGVHAIIDVGDLPDGIIDVGDLPDGIHGIIDVGDLPDGIIDVGDLPDGIHGIIDVGDLPDGIIDVGDLPDGIHTIIDVGDLPDGIIYVGDLPDGLNCSEVKVTLVHRSNNAFTL